MQPGTDLLFDYLNNAIYDPENIFLDIEQLPDKLQYFGSGLQFFVECVIETQTLAKALSIGDLNSPLPSPFNEISAPLKALHSSLKHLTWQAQQIAKGDYTQRVDFMGEFSVAFNTMVEQLAERQKMLEYKIEVIQEKSNTLEEHNLVLTNYAYHDSVTQLYNRTFGMKTLDCWIQEKKQFSLIFADLDGLKYVNDTFGHREGDLYIKNAAKHLQAFLSDAIICRIGGDEFMLLVQDTSYSDAHEYMEQIYINLKNDEYLLNKQFTYSISFGIASVDKSNTESASHILSIADERMYENKRLKKRAGL